MPDFSGSIKSRAGTYIWGAASFAVTLALAFIIAGWNKPAMVSGNVPQQASSFSFIIIYFFVAVALIAATLAVIPMKYLKYVFRGLFAFMFAWGVFILTFYKLPTAVAYILGAAAGLAWLFWAKIWLHDILLLIALAAAGSIFGYLFSPLTFMIFMLVIAVYDFLAVRFGFMVWMADKLSSSTSLPAFIFPKKAGDVNLNIRAVQFSSLKNEESSKREHAILGGGDIGFPVMLAVSVYFKYGLPAGILIGAFAVIGLMAAFFIQAAWLKGKPMPALPPIAAASLIGFLIVYFWF
jgi:presenilin-like A22 family membrane protease